MRNIVFALIAINLLYFLWPREDQAPRPEFTRGQTNLSMLVTLEEVDDRPARGSIVPDDFQPVQAAAAEPVASDTVRVAVAEPQRVRVAVPKPVQVAVAEKPKPVAKAEKPKQKKAESKPKSVVPEAEAVKPLDDPQQLAQVLTESDTPVTGVTDLLGVEEEQQPQQDIPKECYTLGPFKDKKTRNKAIGNLTVVGAKSASRTATERRTRGYWVYLPASSSREAALNKAEDLAAQGFTDYFVVGGGEHNNAISLGLFTLKNGSQRRRKQIRDLGFKPKIEVRYSEINIYWVDYEIEKNVDWAAFMKRHYPNRRIERIKRSCS